MVDSVVNGGSVVDSMVSGVVDNRDGVGNNLVVLLPAGLSVKGARNWAPR